MKDKLLNTERPSDQKFCSECGELIRYKAEICPLCGVRQIRTKPEKNRMAAAVLAFFLGGIGVHRFYLGQIGTGILYLLFFWTLIPSIVAFIEFIIFIFMSDDSFNSKYNE